MNKKLRELEYFDSLPREPLRIDEPALPVFVPRSEACPPLRIWDESYGVEPIPAVRIRLEAHLVTCKDCAQLGRELNGLAARREKDVSAIVETAVPAAPKVAAARASRGAARKRPSPIRVRALARSATGASSRPRYDPPGASPQLHARGRDDGH